MLCTASVNALPPDYRSVCPRCRVRRWADDDVRIGADGEHVARRCETCGGRAIRGDDAVDALLEPHGFAAADLPTRGEGPPCPDCFKPSAKAQVAGGVLAWCASCRVLFVDEETFAALLASPGAALERSSLPAWLAKASSLQVLQRARMLSGGPFRLEQESPRRRYQLRTAFGEATATEQGLGCTFLVGRLLGPSFDIAGDDGRAWLRVNQAPSFADALQRTKRISDGEGRLLGTLRAPRSEQVAGLACLALLVLLPPLGLLALLAYPLLSRKLGAGLELHRPDGSLFARVKRTGSSSFEITSADGASVGTLEKRWGGVTRELLTEGDDFDLNLEAHAPFDLGERAVLLAATLVVDSRYFSNV